MISDAATIQKLALRSDLPRIKDQGFFLFAQLEPHEQKLPEATQWKLIGAAFAALVEHEERNAERPLPAVLPRAYRQRALAADWVELEYACDLAEPYERRNRAGSVLAVTKHLKARVRVFKGAFAYFALDDLRPLETIETDGFTALA